MAAKLLVGLGIVIMLLSGGIYLTQQLALHTAASTYQASVQQYAHESAAVGLVITEGMASLGALVIALGLLVGIVGVIQRRKAAGAAERATM